ncbi:hypothetical protein BaRGS_00021181 [Batillaria attramentaria]|uniref:Uncharacterized protein n=1 Tax=Batillaria attramentaria TaxID=370345 RepID=A0ABD0KK79_9CAEN
MKEARYRIAPASSGLQTLHRKEVKGIGESLKGREHALNKQAAQQWRIEITKTRGNAQLRKRLIEVPNETALLNTTSQIVTPPCA